MSYRRRRRRRRRRRHHSRKILARRVIIRSLWILISALSLGFALASIHLS